MAVESNCADGATCGRLQFQLYAPAPAATRLHGLPAPGSLYHNQIISASMRSTHRVRVGKPCVLIIIIALIVVEFSPLAAHPTSGVNDGSVNKIIVNVYNFDLVLTIYMDFNLHFLVSLLCNCASNSLCR